MTDTKTIAPTGTEAGFDLDKLEAFWKDAKAKRALPCTDPDIILTLIALVRRAAPDSAQAARNQALEDAREGIEILDNLIASIEKHGNYSKESTVSFLNQALQCFDNILAIKSTAAQAATEGDKS